MIHIEEGSSNVYADIGMADASEMLVKARLAAKINEIIQERGWTQREAALVLGMTQPKLSALLRGHFRGVSETKMLERLTRLGRQIRIVVGRSTEEEAGPVEVVFATDRGM
ncbi:hypothetical protein CDEF62S_05679 [Castellaniella defragrans]